MVQKSYLNLYIHIFIYVCVCMNYVNLISKCYSNTYMLSIYIKIYFKLAQF